ncbi:MAG: hypothetical protein AABX05_00550 [Nanoarchaeota archaeon]
MGKGDSVIYTGLGFGITLSGDGTPTALKVQEVAFSPMNLCIDFFLR